MAHRDTLDHADVFTWTELLARVRFGTQVVGGRNIASGAIKAVGSRLASYADFKTGASIRPGLARVAVDMEYDYKTVKSAVAVLRRVGLIRLMKPGSRAGADVYQLVIPVDLLDRDDVVVWSPDRHRLEVKRESDRYQGRHRKAITQDPDAPALQAELPVDNSVTQDHSAPANGPTIGANAGAPCPSTEDNAGAPCPSTQAHGAPATTHDLPVTAPPTSTRDIRTKAAASAHATQDPESPPEDQPPVRAVGVAPAPHTARCAHGLVDAGRADGTPSCALCRRDAIRSPTMTFAAVTPAEGEPLADVIPIRRLA